jgi:hypothetical protein
MAMGIDLSTLPLDGLLSKRRLDPASSNKVNKLRLGIKGNLILVSFVHVWLG